MSETESFNAQGKKEETRLTKNKSSGCLRKASYIMQPTDQGKWPVSMTANLERELQMTWDTEAK